MSLEAINPLTIIIKSEDLRKDLAFLRMEEKEKLDYLKKEYATKIREEMEKTRGGVSGIFIGNKKDEYKNFKLLMHNKDFTDKQLDTILRNIVRGGDNDLFSAVISKEACKKLGIVFSNNEERADAELTRRIIGKPEKVEIDKNSLENLSKTQRMLEELFDIATLYCQIDKRQLAIDRQQKEIIEVEKTGKRNY